MIGESEVCEMTSFQISQVFVYDLFEGPAFQHVLSFAKQNKAVLVYIFFINMYFFADIIFIFELYFILEIQIDIYITIFSF